MRSSITATEASRRFASILDRVQHHGDEFVVERANQPVCAIVPVAPVRRTVADLARFLEDHPLPDTQFARDVKRARNRSRAATRDPWAR